MKSGVCQYQHVQGNKLTQHQLDSWGISGWTLMSHVCSADDLHTYVFKRMKTR